MPERPERPRMAVFGGSFDPVHNGHLFLAGEVVRNGLANEVLFIPARRPPHKDVRLLAAPQHRLEMLRGALAPFPQFAVSDIEIEREEGFSYTFDTLNTLRPLFPEHQLYFLMGMDSLVDLHLWYRATELVQRFDFLIYPRPGVKPPTFAVLSGKFGQRNARKLLDAVADLPLIPVEATRIRASVATGQSNAGRLPESVWEYIRAEGLYSDSVADSAILKEY